MIEILIVEDKPAQREQLVWAAQSEGRKIFEASSAEEACKLIAERDFAVIVTDLAMEAKDAGLRVLEAAKAKNIYTQVIVITAYGTPEISVETMVKGAFDYLERGAPGTDTLAMVKYKINLALEFRDAKLRMESES